MGIWDNRPFMKKFISPSQFILTGKRFKLQVCSFRKWLDLLEEREWWVLLFCLLLNATVANFMFPFNWLNYLGLTLSERHTTWHFVSLGIFPSNRPLCHIPGVTLFSEKNIVTHGLRRTCSEYWYEFFHLFIQ